MEWKIGNSDRQNNTEQALFSGIGQLFPSEPATPHDLVEADLSWDSVEMRIKGRE
jgi:hypothetical protein